MESDMIEYDKTYTLTLTGRQADMLGYALTRAKKDCLDRNTDISRDHARQIEQLRRLLDTCPAS